MQKRQNNYVNLKINGRLFPSWIMMNFKKYKLEEIVDDGEDPCNQKHVSNALEKYQTFLSDFLDYRSPYKDILIYHGLGAGKTASAINIYNMLYNYTPAWNVFILIKASLKGGWLGEIKKWLKKDQFDDRFKNIKFIHYDSPFADRDFINAIKESDSSKQTLYIFDEVHNFIKNVYNNINSKKGKRAQIIYDYICQEKKENNAVRIVLISATPTVNTPFELALLFNLLRPGTFPRNENEFTELYITQGNYQILSPDRKNMFQRRILGLVSYYIGATGKKFATKAIKYKNVMMSDYQTEIYNHYEYIEEQIEKKRAQTKSGATVYRVYTRNACNFTFPNISEKVNGETRPRPNKFRLTVKESELVEKGVDDKVKETGDEEKVFMVTQYMDAMKKFMTDLEKYWSDKDMADQKAKHTLQDDIKIFKDKYKMKFNKFWQGEKKKSSLLQSFYDCGCKMVSFIFHSMKSKGSVIIYSNFVKMEGFEVMKLMLKFFGYTKYNANRGGRDYFRYTEFHGGISRENREKNREAFNSKDNIDSKLIRIMLISPSGTEGLNLYNVRQAHVFEPFWNEVLIEQFIGRAVRLCGHKDLPMDQRHVDVYRYKATRKGNKPTSDEHIEELAKSKALLIQSFLDTVKETAVDCALYRTVNMQDNEWKCFQFDENSLMDKQIGPAFKSDINYDMKLDTGMNSVDAVVKRIKVMKVSAVKKIGDGKYTEPKDFWMYEENGMVYDFEMHFPIGKIGRDDDGALLKYDKDTYIISKVIPIPLLRH